MDAELSVSEDLGTKALPWSTWSHWERAHNWFNADGLPIAGVWQSYRMREYTHRSQVTRTLQTCTAMCPPGYEPDNGSCAGAPQVFVNQGPYGPTTGYTVPRASKIHYVVTEDLPPIVFSTHQWVETQWRFAFGDEFYPGLYESVQRAPHHIAALALPDMNRGDQLVLGNRAKAWRVRLNQNQHDPTKTVRSSDLPLGTNFLEFAIGQGSEVRLQLHFSVVPPVDLLVHRPIIECRPTDERNGDDITLMLRNRSSSQHAVRLESTSSPTGWMGLLLGDRIRVLEPGAEEPVVLRIERMNASAAATEFLPFSVRLTLLGGVRLERTAQVYVRPLQPEGSGL